MTIVVLRSPALGHGNKARLGGRERTLLGYWAIAKAVLPSSNREGCQLIDCISRLPSSPEKEVVGVNAAAIFTEAGKENNYIVSGSHTVLGIYLV